ncbi:MAG: carbohydrate binding family 9 domain-containing protein [Acidobacteriota bacterium]
MIRKTVLSSILLLASLLFEITPVWSQDSHAHRSLQAYNSETAPTVDGLLDEAVWLTADHTAPLTQKEPSEGQPASESTQISVIFTEDSLFLGIACSDSAAEDIIATELRRDGDLSKDDSIWILIDSFHDHRNAFLFATNPLGTQYDALIIDEGNEVNADWDEVWQVASHQNEEGWTVEIRIPFKALRLNAQGGHVGLEFRRIIRRKNEFVFWNSWNRDFKFEEISQAGHLTGLENFELGSRWRLKPYFLGGLGKTGSQGWDNRSDVGIDDLKWRLTSTLTADLTYNTDFAEVELDTQRANFSNPRSQLFFPEKREFFFEGATFFDFAARMNEFSGDTFRAFFSRRIGLTSEGLRLPVLGGGKVTGRMGPISIGLLNVQTEEENDVGSNNFSVLRMRYDLFSRSTIGGIVTNRSGDGSFNRAAGLDTRLVLFDNFIFDGFLMRSATPGLEENQDAYHAKGYWRTDLLDIGLGHLTLEDNFNTELGFAQRAHTRKSIWDVAYKPRPDISWMRQLSLRVFSEYFTTPDNVVEKKITHYNLDFILESGDTLRISPHDRFDRLFRPVTLAPDVVVPPGDYRGQSYLIQFNLDPSRPLAGRIQFSPQRGFFGGSKITFGVFPQWKPVPSLILDLGYDLNKIDVPQGKFTSHIVNATLNYSFSTKLITTATFQYNNTIQVKTFNFRLNYIYRPGDDVFFVFREIQNQLDPTLNDRALLLKFTRSFDF